MSLELQTELLGHTLQSPLILGSGPLSYSADGIIRAHRAGFGAVTTKTIRDETAINPFPHIALSGKDTMINAEKWSDLPAEQWIEEEIPEAKKSGVTLICSIGHTPEEVKHWIVPVDKAGADIIELVSYLPETIVPMTVKAKELTTRPVIVKLSPNWHDPVGMAKAVLEAGADGITAMDSVGPVLRIDIRTARSMVGGERGYGWLTGSAIKPIVLRYVAEIAALSNKPIIGMGGIMTAEDVIEMFMVGATHVGLCTAPILRGLEYIGKLHRGIARLLNDLGYVALADVRGVALKNLPQKEIADKFNFKFDRDACNSCMRCVQVCPYQARALSKDLEMELNEDLCRYCGLCTTVCKPGALKGEFT